MTASREKKSSFAGKYFECCHCGSMTPEIEVTFSRVGKSMSHRKAVCQAYASLAAWTSVDQCVLYYMLASVSIFRQSFSSFTNSGVLSLLSFLLISVFITFYSLNQLKISAVKRCALCLFLFSRTIIRLITLACQNIR